MTDLQSIIRLQSWLSPAFPTGAFSYSHGLEAAINAEMIKSRAGLEDWLAALLVSGPGWNDAVLLTAAWQATQSSDDVHEVIELANALSFTSTRHLETTAQGDAFVTAAAAWIDIKLPESCPLPVAVGSCAGNMNISLEQTLSMYLHAYLSNQIQAVQRLMKLGQQAGVELLASLEQLVVETARRASTSSLDDLGSDSVLADIASLNHETLPSRIFRS